MPDFKPAGWPTVSTRIFAEDPHGLVEFLRTVFGATGEMVGGGLAEMRIGDSMLMVSGTDARDAMAACLYVYVPDADATYARAMVLESVSMEDPRDVPYGDRRAMVQDPWGNVWQIATRL